MPRRRKRPSMYRFIKPAAVSWGPMVILLGAQNRTNAVCDQVKHLSAAVPCPSLPASMFSFAWTAVALGLICSLYLFYRDFVQGQYWMDLHD